MTNLPERHFKMCPSLSKVQADSRGHPEQQFASIPFTEFIVWEFLVFDKEACILVIYTGEDSKWFVLKTFFVIISLE